MCSVVLLCERAERERRGIVFAPKCVDWNPLNLSIILCVFIPHYIVRYAAATPSDDDEVVVRFVAEESSTETRRQEDVSPLVVFWCLEKTTKAFANDFDDFDARERGRDWKGEAKVCVYACVVVRTGKRLWRKRRAKDDDDDDDDDPRRRRKKSTTTTGC